MSILQNNSKKLKLHLFQLNDDQLKKIEPSKKRHEQVVQSETIDLTVALST